MARTTRRGRTGTRTVLTILSAGVLLSSVVAAKKWPVVMLQARATGGCIDFGTAETTPKTGGRPTLTRCDRENRNQHFEVISRKGGFALRNARLDACLGVAPKTVEHVRYWKCDFTVPQLWMRKTAGKQWFMFVSSRTGKCVAWQPPKDAKPGQLVSATCHRDRGEAAQLFRKY